MKATDFKIGNIVHVENDLRPNSKNINHVVIQVGLIDCRLKDTSTGEEFGQYYKFIKPIKITYKWLIDFGFHYDNNWHYTIGINMLTKDHLLNICWIDGAEYPFYRNGTHRLRYIHELQNLYHALTTNELEREEKKEEKANTP